MGRHVKTKRNTFATISCESVVYTRHSFQTQTPTYTHTHTDQTSTLQLNMIYDVLLSRLSEVRKNRMHYRVEWGCVCALCMVPRSEKSYTSPEKYKWWLGFPYRVCK